MRADLSEIAGPRYRDRRRRRRRIGWIGAIQIPGIQQDVNLAGLEAGHLDLDVELGSSASSSRRASGSQLASSANRLSAMM